MKKINICIFVYFYFLTAYFFYLPVGNAVPRIASTISIVKNGSLSIDVYAKHSIDKALIDGKYYNDKAPLSTFLYVPIFWVAHQLEPVFKIPKGNSEYALILQGAYAHYVALLTIVQPIFAFFCFAIFAYLKKNNVSYAKAMLLTTAFTFSTFLFPFTSSYFGHIIAGFFLFASYVIYQAIYRKRDKGGALFLSGFFLGLSVLTEYLTALFGIVVVIDLLLLGKKKGVGGALQKVSWFALGSLPAFLCLLLYNYTVTGDPLSMPYSHVSEASFAEMRTNLGFHSPSLTIMLQLLFGLKRGIFVYAPAFLSAIPFFITNVTQSRKKRFLGILFIVWLVVLSMYYMWDGGSSYGPRHLIPLMMILFFESALWVSQSNFATKAAIALGGVGLFFSLVAQTVGPLFHNEYPNPMFQSAFPRFFAGDFPPFPSNLATLLGFSGYLTPLLWLLMYIVGFFLIGRYCKFDKA